MMRMMMRKMMMIITELTRNVLSLNEAVERKSNLEAGNSAATELQREGRTSKHRVPANHMLRLFHNHLLWRYLGVKRTSGRVFLGEALGGVREMEELQAVWRQEGGSWIVT